MSQQKKLHSKPPTEGSERLPERFSTYNTNPIQAEDIKPSESSTAPLKDDKETCTDLATVEEELSVTLAGPVDKSEFTKYLGLSMDNYELNMDKETATKYKRYIMSLKHGMHAAVPLTCVGGKKCPLGSRCPFTRHDDEGMVDYDDSTYPLCRPCPVERDMVKLHMLDMVREYEVEPDDYTDIAIVSKLATLDVLEFRCNMLLATDAEGLVISEVTSFDPKNSKEFISRKAHPAFEILEKIHRIKQDLLRGMVGTRREKYKKDAATGERTSTTDLTKEMHDLLDILKNAKDENDIIDAEYAEVEVLDTNKRES